MAREPSPEIDDELFNEVYGKAYSGPVASAANSVSPEVNAEKRPLTREKSDDEEEAPDPNAVPTDFTSREAKVWEAKAKATERNWKKRKEEEMICKICGDSGHFTQGCPSTLGANRRNADFFERVPARDKQVRDLFNDRTISQIERDVGCKIRMDEKFLFVSGKDRLILAKGVDAVHKIIQEGKGKHSPSSPKPDRSRSPVRNTTEFHLRHSDSHRSHSPRNSDSQRSRSPRNASRSQSKGYYNERHLDGRLHNNTPKFSKGSPQGRALRHTGIIIYCMSIGGRRKRQFELKKISLVPFLLVIAVLEFYLFGPFAAQAHANFGAKGRPAQSKSPRHTSYLDEFPRTHGENNQFASHVPNDWGIERRGADACSSFKFDMPSHQQTLEELEMEFKREATQLARARDQEEDDENYRHRESLRVIRENYMERVITMRNVHSRKWEEFLEQTFKRQQQAQPSYAQTGYPGFEQRTTHISATHQPMDSKRTYPYASDNYSAPKTHAAYGEFQRERHDDLGRTYGRY